MSPLAPRTLLMRSQFLGMARVWRLGWSKVRVPSSPRICSRGSVRSSPSRSPPTSSRPVSSVFQVPSSLLASIDSRTFSPNMTVLHPRSAAHIPLYCSSHRRSYCMVEPPCQTFPRRGGRDFALGGGRDAYPVRRGLLRRPRVPPRHLPRGFERSVCVPRRAPAAYRKPSPSPVQSHH